MYRRLGGIGPSWPRCQSVSSGDSLDQCPSDPSLQESFAPGFELGGPVGASCRNAGPGLQRGKIDLIHFHVDFLHFPLSRRQQIAHVTTFHGRLDLPDLVPLYRLFRDIPVISISDAQRKPLPWVNWQGTVHHGLPRESFSLGGGKGRYLAFLGRTSPEKGLDQAIEIAKRAEMPLKIAAKIDRVDVEYFETVIKPLWTIP